MRDEAKIETLLATGIFERVSLYRADGELQAVVIVPKLDLVGSAQILIWRGRIFLWNAMLSQHIRRLPTQLGQSQA